jgi:hypothetical protein
LKKKAPVTTTGTIHQLYTSEERKYMLQRKQEFCETLGVILHEHLQPGFAKRGSLQCVGQCPFPIFDWWFGFMNMGTKRRQSIRYVTIDGVKQPRRFFHFQWKNIIPNLGINYKYYSRDHQKLGGRSNVGLTSEYKSLVLTICETTGRVSCHYDQESFVTATHMLIA